MTKDAKGLIGDMIESIGLVESYVSGLSKDGFLASRQIQDAVIRRLEIMGEAVRALPEDLKERHPEIAWRRIAAMRNILIHQYFSVDLELTWSVVQRDLPDLKAKLGQIEGEL